MKVCPRCGYSNPDNAEFCERCRYYLPTSQIAPSQDNQQPLWPTFQPIFPQQSQPNFPQSFPQQPQYVKICPRCNYANPINANFCGNCGYTLQLVSPTLTNLSIYPVSTQQSSVTKNVKFPYLKFFVSVIIAYIMIALILYFV